MTRLCQGLALAALLACGRGRRSHEGAPHARTSGLIRAGTRPHVPFGRAAAPRPPAWSRLSVSPRRRAKPDCTATGRAPPAERLRRETPPRPLMGLLGQDGLGQALDEAKINIFGHVEAPARYNFSNHANDFITGRVFDVENEDPTLNQLELFVERTVDVSQRPSVTSAAASRWIWGGDSRFIHSAGPVRLLRLRRRPEQPVRPRPRPTSTSRAGRQRA